MFQIWTLGTTEEYPEYIYHNVKVRGRFFDNDNNNFVFVYV